MDRRRRCEVLFGVSDTKIKSKHVDVIRAFTKSVRMRSKQLEEGTQVTLI